MKIQNKMLIKVQDMSRIYLELIHDVSTTLVNKFVHDVVNSKMILQLFLKKSNYYILFYRCIWKIFQQFSIKTIYLPLSPSIICIFPLQYIHIYIYISLFLLHPIVHTKLKFHCVHVWVFGKHNLTQPIPK